MNYDPNKDYAAGATTVVPAGEYKLAVTGIEQVQTSEAKVNNGKGKNWRINLLILEGDHAGTTISQTLNVITNKGEPNGMGMNALYSILKLTGWKSAQPSDAEFLAAVSNKPFVQFVGSKTVPGKFNPATQQQLEDKVFNDVQWNSAYKPQGPSTAPASTPVSQPKPADNPFG
jgi:hypothetical protein